MDDLIYCREGCVLVQPLDDQIDEGRASSTNRDKCEDPNKVSSKEHNHL